MTELHANDFKFKRTGVSATTAGVQSDLLLIHSAGRVAIQCCSRNQPGYEADRLMKLHGLTLLDPAVADALDFVICVAVNKAHRKAIERAIRNINDGSMPSRIYWTDFDDIVSPDFDWVSVFERFSL